MRSGADRIKALEALLAAQTTRGDRLRDAIEEVHDAICDFPAIDLMDDDGTVIGRNCCECDWAVYNETGDVEGIWSFKNIIEKREEEIQEEGRTAVKALEGTLDEIAKALGLNRHAHAFLDTAIGRIARLRKAKSPAPEGAQP